MPVTVESARSEAAKQAQKTQDSAVITPNGVVDTPIKKKIKLKTIGLIIAGGFAVYLGYTYFFKNKKGASENNGSGFQSQNIE